MVEREMATILVREGEWARSEFPHPLVTLDFDKEGRLLSVVAPGSDGEYERGMQEGLDLRDELREQIAAYREALEKIDREAAVFVLNDEDAQARHQRIADLAREALNG